MKVLVREVQQVQKLGPSCIEKKNVNSIDNKTQAIFIFLIIKIQ